MRKPLEILMRATMRTLIAAALFLGTAAQTKMAVANPFRSAPPAGHPGATRDVVYTSDAGKPVHLDWYRPVDATGSERLPVVVFLNAFAGRSARGDAFYRAWADQATRQGMIAVVPDMTANLGTGLDALLQHLMTNAARMGADPERIACFAGSGNVYRGLPFLGSPSRSAFRALAFFYGATDSIVLRPEVPMLIVRAGLDRPRLLVDQDSLILRALEQNLPLTVLNLPSAHHAFESADSDTVSRLAIRETLEWMKRVLDPAYQAALAAGSPNARAASALRRGDFAAAARLLEPLVSRSPDDIMLRLSYGEALLNAGRPREASAQFERLRGARIGPRDLGVPAAKAALASGDAEAAIAWLESIPKPFRPPALAEDPAFRSIADRPGFRRLFE